MISFPKYGLKCIEIIEKNGFEAYFVGGCVRDKLLGKEADDIDVTTSAKPEDIIGMFDKTLPTGIKHGTVTVIIDNHPIEVTTYRTEDSYTDARRPDSVRFVSNIKEDLSRRDFTINSLAFNPKSGIIDLFGGEDDIKCRIIKTVGNPNKRFTEDALRILRAFRFASVLDFEIEEETLKYAINKSQNLQYISGERIYSELKKLSTGINLSAIIKLIKANGLAHCGIYDITDEDYKLNNIPYLNKDSTQTLPLFLSAMKHDSSLIKTRLKPDNYTVEMLEFLDDFAENIQIESKSDLKRIMNKFGSDKTELYISYTALKDNMRANTLVKLKNEIERNFEPYMLSHLAIDGKVLVSHGIFGKDIGYYLQKALNFVIDNPEKNNVTELTDFLGL